MADRELRLLVVDNAEDARKVREMLAAAEGSPFTVHCAPTLVAALEALSRFAFDIALVEISLEDSDGLPTFETILRHTSGLPVVIHTGKDNESLAMTAVKGGAQDYLIKGRITSQALVRVLQYSVMRQHGQAQSDTNEAVKANVIGILASKGGVGATTFASHLSVELKRQTAGRVLLLDLDPSSTSATFLMNLESKYTIADAATNLNRLDATFWEGVVAKGPSGLDVMQAPGNAGYSEPLCGERLRHVLRFARMSYDTVVLDLGRLSPISINLLQEIGEVYVVATTGLPEIFEANRAVRMLLDLGFTNNQVHLVVNRVPKTISLFTADSAYFEKAVGFPVFSTIFDCSREIEVAYAKGRFLDEALPIRKQIAELVASSIGADKKAPARGLLGLFKLARTRLAIETEPRP